MENIDIEDKTTWSKFISEDQLWESVEKTTIIYNANKALLIDILLKHKITDKVSATYTLLPKVKGGEKLKPKRRIHGIRSIDQIHEKL